MQIYVLKKIAVCFNWKIKDASNLFEVLDINMLVRLKRYIVELLCKGENLMNDRIKIFGIVALLGFMAGVVAQLTYDYAIPWLASVLPAVLEAKFLVSGFAGACLTLVMVSVWGYFSKNREQAY